MREFKDEEYAAFGYNKETEQYEPIGRPVGNELLCRGRLNEAIEKGWISKNIDSSKVIIRKRQVVTCYGDWGPIKEER